MAKQTTTKVISQGICNFCKDEFDKAKMSQHLKHCKQRALAITAGEAKAAKSKNAQKTKLFHIVVEGRYNPQYWMHLEVPATDTFWDLDQFLRDTWLECCDHLSEFKVGRMSYSMEPDDFMFGDLLGEDEEQAEEDEEDESDDTIDEEEGPLAYVDPELFDLIPADVVAKLRQFQTTEELLDYLREETQSKKMFDRDMSLPLEERRKNYLVRSMLSSLLQELEQNDMDVPLEKGLKVGQKFTHEYDFGSTTYLALRVVSEREGFIEDKESDNIEILASNNAPEMPCVVCGKPAKKVAPGYYFGIEEHAYCSAKCAKKNKEEFSYEEMLPVVNSPRVGVCAYTG